MEDVGDHALRHARVIELQFIQVLGVCGLQDEVRDGCDDRQQCTDDQPGEADDTDDVIDALQEGHEDQRGDDRHRHDQAEHHRDDHERADEDRADLVEPFGVRDVLDTRLGNEQGFVYDEVHVSPFLRKGTRAKPFKSLDLIR